MLRDVSSCCPPSLSLYPPSYLALLFVCVVLCIFQTVFHYMGTSTFSQVQYTHCVTLSAACRVRRVGSVYVAMAWSTRFGLICIAVRWAMPLWIACPRVFTQYTVMPEISVAVVRPDAPLEKVCLLGYVHACTRVLERLR